MAFISLLHTNRKIKLEMWVGCILTLQVKIFNKVNKIGTVIKNFKSFLFLSCCCFPKVIYIRHQRDTIFLSFLLLIHKRT